MIKVPNQFPTLDIKPRIALIGEAPGAEEVQQGKPFVGQAGRLLDSLLHSAGIIRNGCFVGNVYQFRPPNNNIEAVDKNSIEWKNSLAELFLEIERFVPQCIICLGETPLKYITGNEGITSWRGSLLATSTPDYSTPNSHTMRKVVATFHPASLFHTYTNIPIVQSDLKRAKRYALGEISPPIREHKINPSYDEAISYITYCHTQPLVSVDIETSRKTGHIVCIGLAHSELFSLTIPFDNRWSLSEEHHLWIALEQLLRNPAVGKVMQNAQFDISVLATKYGILTQNLWMDTMLAHHNCYPEFPKSLAFQTSLYTYEPYYKWEGKMSSKADGEKTWTANYNDVLARYNGKDCCVTMEIAKHLVKELDDLGARKGYALDMACIPIALEMTLRGIKVDEKRITERLAKIDKDIAASQAILNLAFGKPVNSKSGKQLKALLYEELNLPCQYKRGTKTVTCDAAALLHLARRFPNNLLNLILADRKIRTQRSFFQLDLRAGRIHPSYNICGTETGRWSSSDSILGGRNLMNIPPDCRDIFIADEGMTLIGFDQSAAEARVVAYRAYIETADASYKTLVESGVKPHNWFGKRLIARGIFPISESEFMERKTPASEMYYLLAKKSVHAFSYGMGPEKFAQVVAEETDGEVAIEMKLAKQIKEALYEELSALPMWQDAVRRYLSTSKQMFNAFGRNRIFFQRWGDDLFGEAYAFEPQSTVADNTATILLRIAERIPTFQFLQQGYDSVLGQVKSEEAEAAIKEIKPLAEQPITLKAFNSELKITFTIPVVFKVGRDWQNMEERK